MKRTENGALLFRDDGQFLGVYFGNLDVSTQNILRAFGVDPSEKGALGKRVTHCPIGVVGGRVSDSHFALVFGWGCERVRVEALPAVRLLKPSGDSDSFGWAESTFGVVSKNRDALKQMFDAFRARDAFITDTLPGQEQKGLTTLICSRTPVSVLSKW